MNIRSLISRILSRIEGVAEDGMGSNRSFGIVFTIVFLIIALYPVFFNNNVRIWSLLIAGAFLVVSIVRPNALYYLNRVWFKFGLLLHHIVNPIIMGAIFFLVLTPMAIFMRLKGNKFLDLEKDDSCESYWVNRDEPGPKAGSFNQQF